MPQFKTERVLIWGKTYPELSKKYAETVCTAGVREDGSPIRLYPVPLRYLETGSQYKLYDWIHAPIAKSEIDTRPESFKVDASRIQLSGHIDTTKKGWGERAEYIFKDASWQYPSMGEMQEAQAYKRASLGVITPGEIVRVSVVQKPAAARAEYDSRLSAIQSQTSLFLPEYKELGFRPFEIRLHWRCAIRCKVCSMNPHAMQVLDWGLMELARKNAWDSGLAKARLETLATSGKHDFKLFVGNMKQHEQSFVIVGLWYPLKQPARATPQIGLI